MGVVKAGVLCGLSQLSIPVGAVLGILMAPVKESITAKWMAFGAGALVFAVATDLFGETLFSLMRAAEEEEGCNAKCMLHFWKLLAQVICCIIGAVGFVELNKVVERFARSSVDSARQLAPAPLVLELGQAVTGAEKVEDGDVPRPDAMESNDSSAPRGGMAGRKSTTTESLGEIGDSAAKSVAFRRSATAMSVSTIDCPIAALKPLRQATSTSLTSLERSSPEGLVVDKASVAYAMWLGVLLDSVPEALMMACKTSAGTLEPEFILAVCIANFPEAFSGASLLVTQGMSMSKVLGMWLMAFAVEVAMCMAFAGFIGDVNPEDSPTFSIVVSAAEGLTGGAMLTMIASAMLPEALHGAGELSGILFILGFSLSVLVTGIGPVHEQALKSKHATA